MYKYTVIDYDTMEAYVFSSAINAIAFIHDHNDMNLHLYRLFE